MRRATVSAIYGLMTLIFSGCELTPDSARIDLVSEGPVVFEARDRS
jgi:hypothetical protein